MPLWFVRAYSKLYVWTRRYANWRLRGLSALLRSLTRDYVLCTPCGQLFLNHKVAASYACLVSGDWVEPEPHQFLDELIGRDRVYRHRRLRR
jgi:hypothetical protein